MVTRRSSLQTRLERPSGRGVRVPSAETEKTSVAANSGRASACSRPSPPSAFPTLIPATIATHVITPTRTATEALRRAIQRGRMTSP
ncbi:hypothetical protein NS206_01240 [Microbacterium testaceum]|nr:hypothetical protein NS206_01240 [Microbacterium testaceum]